MATFAINLSPTAEDRVSVYLRKWTRFCSLAYHDTMRFHDKEFTRIIYVRKHLPFKGASKLFVMYGPTETD